MSNSARAKKRYIKEVVAVMGKNLLIAIIIIAVAMALGHLVNGLWKEAADKVTYAFGFIILLTCCYLLLYSWRMISFFLFKSNLKNPKSSVISFLTAVKNELYERAYNGLTDPAQNLGAVTFPKNSPVQEKIRDIVINDLATFKSFWQNIKFDWEIKTGDSGYEVAATALDDESALVNATIHITNEETPSDFQAKFLTIKSENIWFVANGFFWPT